MICNSCGRSCSCKPKPKRIFPPETPFTELTFPIFLNSENNVEVVREPCPNSVNWWHMQQGNTCPLCLNEGWSQQIIMVGPVRLPAFSDGNVPVHYKLMKFMNGTIAIDVEERRS